MNVQLTWRVNSNKKVNKPFGCVGVVLNKHLTVCVNFKEQAECNQDMLNPFYWPCTWIAGVASTLHRDLHRHFYNICAIFCSGNCLQLKNNWVRQFKRRLLCSWVPQVVLAIVPLYGCRIVRKWDLPGCCWAFLEIRKSCLPNPKSPYFLLLFA